jgi:hypothetical protein
MRFQIAEAGWPVGQFLIPAGTVIDTEADDDWSRLVRERGLPLNARPMDNEAYEFMVRAYPNHKELIVRAQTFEMRS